jgi:hypothetical protein
MVVSRALKAHHHLNIGLFAGGAVVSENLPLGIELRLTVEAQKAVSV